MATVVVGRRPVRAGEPNVVPGRAPWTAEDCIRWFLAVGTGGVVIAVSWYVCAGDASFNRQIGPLDAAVAGAVLVGLGNAMWLLRGRRAVGARRQALLPSPAAEGAGSAGVVRPAAAVETSAGPVLLVAGDGMVRFHRPECALAAGRGWSSAPRQDHQRAGRLPCGVCRP